VGFQDVSYPSGIGLPSVPFVKWGVAFVDLDNDGWLDLVTANGHVYPQVDTLQTGARYREPKLVQYNQGDGTFCDASDQSGAAITERESRVGWRSVIFLTMATWIWWWRICREARWCFGIRDFRDIIG